LSTSYAAQAQFGNYDPSSFGWPRQADLVPFSFAGVNFGQCARAALPVFTALLTELVPHIKGGLKAGSCWAYAATDDLPDGSWSFHHFGIGMDVNWNVNHMGNDIPDATGDYAIPRGIATELARKYGCEWGGNWLGGFHDNMHFEIHLSPARAAAVKIPSLNKDASMSAAEVKALQNSINALSTRIDAVHSAVTIAVHGDRAGKDWPKGHPNSQDDLGPIVRQLALDVAQIKAATPAPTPKVGP
jgi:D-alanyl-D-alanine carboxypeptidase-like protein